MTAWLATDDARAIPAALEALNRDALIVFPTDTVYGVGCLAARHEAVARLYTVKGRPEDKPIPILIGRVQDAEKVAGRLPDMATKLADVFWPGPLTLVVPRRPGLPDAFTGETTVGLRLPDHEFTQKLLAAAGPMAVTSANLSGQPPALSAQAAQTALGDKVALILDGGMSPGGQPSTVVDCTATVPQILRAGPISRRDIEQALR